MAKSGRLNLAGDAELRAALTDFFTLVQEDEGMPAPGSGVTVSIFSTADRQYRLVNGTNFSVRPETREAATRAARRGAKLLGPVSGHERDVDAPSGGRPVAERPPRPAPRPYNPSGS